MTRILLVDDDHEICALLSLFLRKSGFEVEAVHNGDDAVKILRAKEFTLALCDYRLPDTNGVEMLQRMKVLQPAMAVIIITGYSDVRIAVQTFKYGACDYVVKPLYPDEILVTIRDAIAKQENKTEAYRAGSNGKSGHKTEDVYIKGKSPQAETVQRYIDLIAPFDMSVIISGETGTGKEFVAKAIHYKSERAGCPFVAIDCGALPKDLAGSELFGHMRGSFTGAIADRPGSFEAAHTGTLFLDEIGNLSYENQVKLLRVLQERKIRRLGSTKDIEIDVRIITATNEDLAKFVKEGKFREDLYHRLNEFRIDISPLRERKDDILLFASHFLKRANESLGKHVDAFAPEVVEKLIRYYWYGNLRELNNVIKRAVLLATGERVTIENLPQEIISPELMLHGEIADRVADATSDSGLLKSVSSHAQRQAIVDTLEKTGFNKTKAAELLNIDRKTLYNKLKAFDIKL